MNLRDIHQYLFSPLQKEYYCELFLILSIVGFIFIIIGMVLFIHGIYTNKGNVYYIRTFLGIILYFVFYLQNRLMYSICTKTIVE